MLANPEARLADFTYTDFLCIARGGMIRDTAFTEQLSEVLRSLGPIEESPIRSYLQAWKAPGRSHFSDLVLDLGLTWA